MSTVMMQLGAIQFGISTGAYQNLARAARYKWGEQERFGKNPALQFTGVDAETITIDGTIYPEFRGSIDTVDGWRTVAAQGKPLSLIDGLGTILGEWVIESVEERKSIFATAGVARRYDFTMTLKFYDEPSYSEAQVAAALAMNVAPTVPAAIGAANIGSTAESAMGGLADTLAQAGQKISAVAAEVSQSVQPALDAVKRGITIASTVKYAAQDAQRLVKSIKNINSLSTAQRALDGLRATSSNAASIGANVSKTLSGITDAFSSAGEPAEAVSAVRGGLVSVNRTVTSAASIVRQIDSLYKKFT